MKISYVKLFLHKLYEQLKVKLYYLINLLGFYWGVILWTTVVSQLGVASVIVFKTN